MKGAIPVTKEKSCFFSENTDLIEHRPEITWRGRNSENKAPVGPRDQDSQSGEAHIAILCFYLGASYEQIENGGDSY